MWQAIKIAEQNYFFQCSAEGDCIHYYLYNLKEVWSEQCNTNEVIQRAKNLNKRISYDSETVIRTIKSMKPTTVTLEAAEGGHALLLKYHVLGRPFNFEWKLKTLPVDEFQKLVTYPLFMSIHYLSEQIRELKDSIKKKDIEIGQYKVEGAVLKRSTVTTASFDEEAFDKRYAKINDISKGFLDISEEIKPSFPIVSLGDSSGRTSPKPNTSSFVSNEKLKVSPGKSKRRKMLEYRRQQMERFLKAKDERMEYQSSQSQTPPKDELADIFQSLSELDALRMASTS